MYSPHVDNVAIGMPVIEGQQQEIYDSLMTEYLHMRNHYTHIIRECNDKVNDLLTINQNLNTRIQSHIDRKMLDEQKIKKLENKIRNLLSENVKLQNNFQPTSTARSVWDRFSSLERKKRMKEVRLGGNKKQLRNTKLHKSKTYRKKSKTYRKI